MTREEHIIYVKNLRTAIRIMDCFSIETMESLDAAIKALEQEPYEKFESVKDHICKLASDYKCWDNRLTDDEALELCRILEQESCEDAISRQVVNELFDSEIKMYKERIETRKGSNYHDETERIKEFRSRIANAEYWQNKIEALPPVTPTRKKGKWEYDAYKDRNDGHCNQCGHYMRYGAKTKFCPDCGAEMENGEDGND